MNSHPLTLWLVSKAAAVLLLITLEFILLFTSECFLNESVLGWGEYCPKYVESSPYIRNEPDDLICICR